MAKIIRLNEQDRKLLIETQQKLVEATKLGSELTETIEFKSDPEAMKAIKQAKADVKAGRVKDYCTLFKEKPVESPVYGCFLKASRALL